jgi:hypothetical protein
MTLQKSQNQAKELVKRDVSETFNDLKSYWGA